MIMRIAITTLGLPGSILMVIGGVLLCGYADQLTDNAMWVVIWFIVGLGMIATGVGILGTVYAPVAILIVIIAFCAGLWWLGGFF